MRSSLVFMILSCVAIWHLFVKAGEKGWKSLIPYYNVYIMSKLAGCTNLFKWLVVSAVTGHAGLIVIFGEGILDMLDIDSIASYNIENMMHVLGRYLLPGLIILISLIAWLVLKAIINYRFTKCYTDKDIYVALATIGVIPSLWILEVIVFFILALDEKVEYKALVSSEK